MGQEARAARTSLAYRAVLMPITLGSGNCIANLVEELPVLETWMGKEWKSSCCWPLNNLMTMTSLQVTDKPDQFSLVLTRNQPPLV